MYYLYNTLYLSDHIALRKWLYLEQPICSLHMQTDKSSASGSSGMNDVKYNLLSSDGAENDIIFLPQLLIMEVVYILLVVRN